MTNHISCDLFTNRRAKVTRIWRWRTADVAAPGNLARSLAFNGLREVGGFVRRDVCLPGERQKERKVWVYERKLARSEEWGWVGGWSDDDREGGLRGKGKKLEREGQRRTVKREWGKRGREKEKDRERERKREMTETTGERRAIVVVAPRLPWRLSARRPINRIPMATTDNIGHTPCHTTIGIASCLFLPYFQNHHRRIRDDIRQCQSNSGPTSSSGHQRSTPLTQTPTLSPLPPPSLHPMVTRRFYSHISHQALLMFFNLLKFRYFKVYQLFLPFSFNFFTNFILPIINQFYWKANDTKVVTEDSGLKQLRDCQRDEKKREKSRSDKEK